jgi:hypothetical protein
LYLERGWLLCGKHFKTVFKKIPARRFRRWTKEIRDIPRAIMLMTIEFRIALHMQHCVFLCIGVVVSSFIVHNMHGVVIDGVSHCDFAPLMQEILLQPSQPG